MSAISKKFYNLFWTNEVCRQIFSLHKEQLLEKREIDFGHEKKIYYLQKIVISNDKSKKLSTELVANRIGNKKVDLNDNLEVATTKYFDEAKFQALVETHFGKAIKKVEKKLSAGTLSQVRFGFELLSSLSSEEKLIKFLKGYHLLPENINSFAQVETILNKTVSSLITKETILEFLDSFDKISEFYTNEIYQNLLDSNKFYSDIIYDFESFKDRLQIFDLLYEAQVFEGGIYKTFYECYNCEAGVFKSITTLKAKPSKIALKCPVCNKETFFLSPYKICDEIFSHITDKDGIIKFAIKHLLDEKSYTYKENFLIPPDIELDFVAFRKGDFSAILELKMFKTDTPEHTHKSNLNTAISQAIKIKEKLIRTDNSFKNSYSIITTNYVDKLLIKDLLNVNKTKMRALKIKLLTLNELGEYCISSKQSGLFLN